MVILNLLNAQFNNELYNGDSDKHLCSIIYERFGGKKTVTFLSLSRFLLLKMPFSPETSIDD